LSSRNISVGCAGTCKFALTFSSPGSFIFSILRLIELGELDHRLICAALGAERNNNMQPAVRFVDFFFLPPFQPTMLLLLLCHGLLFCAGFLLSRLPHRPHSLLLSKGHGRHGPAAGRLLGPF
jgi:hypothetical protein